MNSDLIARKFGSYDLTLVLQRASERLASLGSRHGSLIVPRTLARTAFREPMPEAVQSLHQRVLAGSSIGATCREAGWQVYKTASRLGSLETHGEYAICADHFRIRHGSAIAMHEYRFELEQAGRRLHYADILELHHPEHVDLAALARMLPRAERLPSDRSPPALARLVDLLRTARPSPRATPLDASPEAGQPS